MQKSSTEKARSFLPAQERGVTNEEMGAEFCATIHDLSAKRAGEKAHRTAAAAKRWKAKLNAPDSASLVNTAINHPTTRAWLLWKLCGDWSKLMDPRVQTELVAVLLRAEMRGDRAAKRILQQVSEARAVPLACDPSNGRRQPSPALFAGSAP